MPKFVDVELDDVSADFFRPILTVECNFVGASSEPPLIKTPLSRNN